MHIWRQLQKKAARHGVRKLLYEMALRAVNIVVPFKVLRAVYVEEPHPDFLEIPPPYTGTWFTPAALRNWTLDASTELSTSFLDRTLPKGDECYGFTLDGTLAAYGWYAHSATPVAPGLVLHFAPGYVYMYKGFTHDLHRGKRLHAIGMTRALQHYRSKGLKGVVSYVESQNFDSLKSCARMGYRVFGSMYLVEIFGRHFAWSSPGCARFAFRLECQATPKDAFAAQ